MARISITRRYLTGIAETPHRYVGGYYKVADPAFGSDKKKDRLEFRVRSLEEVLGYVERGFHVRMSAGRRGDVPSLISPDSLVIYGTGDKA